MKSLMIITLVSGLNVQPAQYQDVQSCMAAAEEVKVQSSVKDVACIPSRSLRACLICSSI